MPAPTITRRRLLSVIFLLFPALAASQTKHDPPEYTELKIPQPAETPGKVEVVEFFWYGCPSCYKFELTLESWLPELPSDVTFRRVPAILSARWAVDAEIFYVFEALGLVEKLHRPLFDAIHRDRLKTDNADAMAAWLSGKGVDAKRFEQARKSIGVQSKVRRAGQLSASFQIEGVPTLAVQGRYTVSAGHGPAFDEMIATADKLIARARTVARPKAR